MVKGRSRRPDVKRYKNGSVSNGDRPYRQADVRVVAGWARYRDNARQFGLDERLSTFAGRLFFQGLLTPAQYEAAQRWATMLDTYDVLVLGGRRTVRGQAFERTSPGEAVDRLDDPEIREFRQTFEESRRALRVAGLLAERAVTCLCRNESGALYDDTVRGLDALAAHWGLTGVRKGVTRA